MNYYIVLAIAIIGVLVQPILVVKFRKVFYQYLFLFIPVYLLIFRELYVRLTHVYEIPDGIKMIRDVAWVYILTCFILWILLSRKRIHFPIKVGIPLIVFTGYLLIQLPRGYYELGELETTLVALRNTLMYIPTVLMALYMINDKDDLRMIIKGYCYVMIVAGLYGLIQMTFKMETVYYMLSPENIAVRYLYSSFFSDYNAFGWFSGIVLSLTLPQKEVFRNKMWLYYLTISLSIFWLIASQSRTAIIVLIAVLLLMVIFKAIKLSNIVSITLVFIFILAVLAILSAELLEGHRVMVGVFGDTRIIETWPILWNTFKENPIFGYGFGVFGFAALRGGIDVANIGGHIGVDNFYLTLALNTGIIGLLLFFAIMAIIFQSSFKLIRNSKDKFIKNLVIGITIALVVNLIYAIPSNFLEGFPQSVHFWFLVGTVVAIGNLHRNTVKQWQGVSHSE